MHTSPTITRTLVFLVATLAGATTGVSDTANWPRWRGPDNNGSAGYGTVENGSAEAGHYPSRLDDTTLRWQAPLPGKGCSTPIVWDQTVYLTAPIEEKDAILSFAWDGTQRWNCVFGEETAGKHRNGSGCNASAATDGSGIFAYFKSGTLAAVERDGEVRWETDLVQRFGKDNRFWDNGTSPVLTTNDVVFARMHAGDSWLAAFDKITGELTWKVTRNYPNPLEGDQCYTTPLVMPFQGREAVLVWGSNHVTIHDASNGEIQWSCGKFNPGSVKLWPAIATPVIADDMLVICYGRNDRRTPRMHGIRLKGSGDMTDTARVWSRDDISSFVPSPVLHDGRVYLVRDRGEIECLNPQTGKTIWSDAFPKNRASFYASPVIADRKLYAAREDGVVFVAGLSDEGLDLLSTNDLDEPVIGSPVPVSGNLLVRGENHLFCFQSRE